MKIMILAHAIRAGGGRATCTNILKALSKLDRENEYYILVPDQPEYRNLGLEGSRREIHYYRRRFGHVGRLCFDKFSLKRIAARFQPDVVWGMGGLGFIDPPCTQIVSLQNSYIVYDEKYLGPMNIETKLWLFFLRRWFKRQLPNTQLVFCQTATIQKRIHELFDYKGKTFVTGKAVSAFVEEGDESVPQTLRPYGDKFKLLYVTRYYPHKGLEILIETLDRYREELAGVVAFTTIEPEQHPNAARLLKSIREKGLEDRVVNLGRLPQESLAAYYCNCDALLMPTRLESFSGSYLEAMHFGLPILTSDLDFAHEVCGESAIYFDPWNAETIKEAIVKLKGNPKLSENLISRGKTQLQSYIRSWDEITENVLENLHEIVAT